MDLTIFCKFKIWKIFIDFQLKKKKKQFVFFFFVNGTFIFQYFMFTNYVFISSKCFIYFIQQMILYTHTLTHTHKLQLLTVWTFQLSLYIKFSSLKTFNLLAKLSKVEYKGISSIQRRFGFCRKTKLFLISGQPWLQTSWNNKLRYNIC